MAGSNGDSGSPEQMPESIPAEEVPETAETADVTKVFDAWIASTGRTSSTILDKKRRAVIKQALSRYPVADVLCAVEGWKYSPFHRGANEQKKVFNEISLLLRNSAKIEEFRDLARGHLPAAPVASNSAEEARIAAIRAERIAEAEYNRHTDREAEERFTRQRQEARAERELSTIVSEPLGAMA